MDGDAAEQAFGEGQAVAVFGGDTLENFDGFTGDFCPDAVPGEDEYVELH
jgi:hypothetical protein